MPCDCRTSGALRSNCSSCLEQRWPVEALEDLLCHLVPPKVTCKWNGVCKLKNSLPASKGQNKLLHGRILAFVCWLPPPVEEPIPPKEACSCCTGLPVCCQPRCLQRHVPPRLESLELLSGHVHGMRGYQLRGICPSLFTGVLQPCSCLLATG